jgi:hypothetical protein
VAYNAAISNQAMATQISTLTDFTVTTNNGGTFDKGTRLHHTSRSYENIMVHQASPCIENSGALEYHSILGHLIVPLGGITWV